MVTETDEIARLLDRAALRWPGLSRGQLLVRLLLEARDAEEQRLDTQRRQLRAVLDAPDPRLAGIGRSDEIRRMRDEDWPA